MHARNKQIASAIGIQLPIRLGRLNSLSPTPARLTRGHLAPDAALGLFWLVLACLACAALLRAPKSKNCSAPKKLFSSPPAAHTQLAHTQLTHHTTGPHNFLTHNLLTHNLITHNLSTHNLCPPAAHTQLAHTQLTDKQLVPTQLVHTWHLWHWAGSGGALGSRLAPWSPPPFAWQAWHLATSIVTLPGRRGTRRHRS